jgi:hypothetical protein
MARLSMTIIADVILWQILVKIVAEFVDAVYFSRT